MRGYTNDLRKRIIEARKRFSAEEVRKRFEVSKRSVERYWSHYLATGSYSAAEPSTRISILDEHKETVIAWIKKSPSMTLVEIKERCESELGISLTVQAIWYRLKAYGLSYKKNSVRQRAKAS